MKIIPITIIALFLASACIVDAQESEGRFLFKDSKVKLSTFYAEIIPAGKAARYFQAENKIEALINARLALDIPLIEAK